VDVEMNLMLKKTKSAGDQSCSVVAGIASIRGCRNISLRLEDPPKYPENGLAEISDLGNLWRRSRKSGSSHGNSHKPMSTELICKVAQIGNQPGCKAEF
jgi:hypothetical protein